MLEKYREALDFLVKNIESSDYQTKHHSILKIIVKEQYSDFEKTNFSNYNAIEFTRTELTAKHKNKKFDDITTDEAREYIRVTELQNKFKVLINQSEKFKNKFDEIGLYPQLSELGGSRGNEKKVYLDFKFLTTKEDVSERVDTTELDKLDIYRIKYYRQDNETIKTGFFAKVFFKNNELKMTSAKGTLLMVILLGCFFLICILAILNIIVLAFLPSIKFTNWFSLISIFTFPILLFLIIREVFQPLIELLTNRVAKASHLLFLHMNESDADMELFRGEDTLSVARITRFTAECPICSAQIELRKGKPDQKYPLVGRCKEAPHAHVYSFDRMEMKGYFLGHEGYLKDNDC